MFFVCFVNGELFIWNFNGFFLPLVMYEFQFYISPSSATICTGCEVKTTYANVVTECVRTGGGGRGEGVKIGMGYVLFPTCTGPELWSMGPVHRRRGWEGAGRGLYAMCGVPRIYRPTLWSDSHLLHLLCVLDGHDDGVRGAQAVQALAERGGSGQGEVSVTDGQKRPR